MFLAFTGLYWLHSFSEKPHRALLRVWYIAIAISAVAFILSVGFAYSSRTIPTWDIWQAPAAIVCNAVVGGPLLALTSYACAGCVLLSRRRGVRLLGVSVAAMLVNIAVYALQIHDVYMMHNAVVAVSELVPAYWWALVAFVVLAVGAQVLAWNMIKRLPADPTESAHMVASRENKTIIAGLCLATAVCLLGIFVMRFCFYLSHITVGLGV